MFSKLEWREAVWHPGTWHALLIMGYSSIYQGLKRGCLCILFSYQALRRK